MRKRGERVDCGRNMIHISKTKELELKKQSLSVGSILQRLISKEGSESGFGVKKVLFY